MLQTINESLEELLTIQNVNLTSEDRVGTFKAKIQKQSISGQYFMRVFMDISITFTSRDLII
jgi:hypothetical protein